jgi:hypothetical protein
VRASAVLAAVASIAAFTACGGGDGGRDATASRAQRSIQPRAQQRAEASLLEPGDFPPGWRATPSRRDEEAEDLIRSCLGLDFSELTIVGEAVSRNFAARHTQASSRATVFTDDEQAEEAFDKRAEGMDGPAAERCFDAQIEELNGVEVDRVDVFPVPVSRPHGIDQVAGWQIVVTATLLPESPSTTVYLGLVALRRGDTVAQLQSTDARPSSPSLRVKLVRALARRM